MLIKTPYRTVIFCSLWLLCLWSCRSEPEPQLAIEQPEHFPAVTYTLKNNPLTKEGFELGKMLFYDPVLSKDSTISCSSCHQQAAAFSDPVHKISIGINERRGTRNAPPIFNVGFINSFFWDGGVKHVDFIPLNAISNPNEMDESLEHVVTKLQHHPFYPQKFKQAFGSDSVTSQKMLFALSQFMISLVSSNSKYDQYSRGNLSVLTEQEIEGMHLFTEQCSSCHKPPLFMDERFVNNGLDYEFRDIGREIITENELDKGKFIIPSLRNIELTGPYMHDGRFQTLEQVLEHYRHDIKNSHTLDSFFKQESGEVKMIQLSDDEKKKIISFLNTLTDYTFTKDKRFSNPFVK